MSARRSRFAAGVRLDGVRCAVARRRPTTRDVRSTTTHANATMGSKDEGDADGTTTNGSMRSGDGIDGSGSSVESFEKIGRRAGDSLAREDSAGDAEAASSIKETDRNAEGGEEPTETSSRAESSKDATTSGSGDGVVETPRKGGSAKMIVDVGETVVSSKDEGDIGPGGTVRLRRGTAGAAKPKPPLEVTATGTVRKRVDPSRGVGTRRSYAREALQKVRNDAAEVLENIRASRDESDGGAGGEGRGSTTTQIAGEAMALAKVTAEALRGTGPITMDEWTMAMSTALSAVWRELWYRWSSRLKQVGKWTLGFTAVMSAAFHYVVGPAFISPRLPMIGDVASSAVGRPVRVGRCKSLSFMGVLGFGKVVEVGPVVLGPSETEKSIVEVDSVKVSYDVFRSILRRKIVTEISLEGVTATLRQGKNSSWFGYPEDTQPLSSRPTLNVASGSKSKKSVGPGVELRVVRVDRGVAALHLNGDPEPRQLNNLHGKAVINHRGRIDLDVTTLPDTRKTPPLKRQTTMLAPQPVRHLRSGLTASEKRSLDTEEMRGNNGGQIRVFMTYLPPHLRTGGSFRSRAYPDLRVRAQLNNTSAAVMERMIPGLPVDIKGGRLDGEVRIMCNSQATWTFPDFGGQLKGKHLWFHFFDSTDDFADTDVDLVFEGQRMYIHGGEGSFGHVPLTVTGDLDLNSAGGEYRLSAQVSPVDAHKLRETLGVRPVPRPMAGSLKGFLYCSGPLEAPVFTGRAQTTKPAEKDITTQKAGTELAWAEEAIQAAASQGAVAAYDRVPFKSANAVFTADIKKGEFMLHSAEATPVDGGKLRASGRISTKPNALYDPDALDVEGTAVDLDFLKLAKRLARGQEPPWLDKLCPASPANVSGTFVGALSEPVLNAQWTVEDEEYKGNLTMTREGVTTSVETPVLEMKASLATEFQPLETQLQATTIEEALIAGKPKVTDAEADLTLNGADIASWMVTDEIVDAPDRLRLRLGGRTRIAGRFDQPESATLDASSADEALPSFSGDVQLDNLRVNKLEFAPKIAGRLDASESGLFLRTKNRAGEFFDTSVEKDGKSMVNIRRNNLRISADIDDYAGSVEVAGLLLDDLEIASLRGKVESANAKIDLRERVGEGSLQLRQPRLSGVSGEALEADVSWNDRIVSLQRAVLKQAKSQYEADGDYSLPDAIWDALPSERVTIEMEEGVDGYVEAIDQAALEHAGVPVESKVESIEPIVIDVEPVEEVASASASKKWWPLKMHRPAFLDQAVNHVKVMVSKKPEGEKVKGVFMEVNSEELMSETPTDEAPETTDKEEVESEPTEATEVSNSTETVQEEDDAAQELASVGDATETVKKTLKQMNTKPTMLKSVLRSARNVVKPNKGNEKKLIQKPHVSLPPYETEFTPDVSGAWRFRLAIPEADIEEMLPALRVITGLRKGDTPEEYGRAKQAFLAGVERSGTALIDLARQVEDVSSKPKSEPVVEAEVSEGEEDVESKTQTKLPGLQELKGRWHGMIQANGGGDDQSLDLPQPTESVRFDIAGGDWQWGPYKVERVEAQGDANSTKGLTLKKMEVTSDAASLSISGAIGGEHQDANFSVRDLPAPLLGSFIGPLLPEQSDGALPPVAGDLLVQGHLGGSVKAPEGELMMRLRDGKIGSVKLKSAELTAELNEARRAEFEGEAMPAIGTGLVRIAGTVPLPEASDQSLAVDWRVREHGMSLLTAFVPEVADWQSGAADISLHVRGTPAAPVYDGVMEVRKGRIMSPLLARPIYPANATIRIQRNTLYADDVEARSGKGSVRIKGAIPVLKPNRSSGGETWEGLVARADTQGGLKLSIDGLDVRARNVFNGQLNANIVAKGTVTAPELGGDVRFSRGTAFVQQQQAAPEEALNQIRSGTFPSNEDSRGVLAGILERAARANDPNHGESGVENDLMNERNLEKLQNMRLKNLKLYVGPEMSVVYPFVLNFGVSGELTLDGAVDSDYLRPNGTLQFERGDVNLVATQIRLDRDHPNKVVFTPEQGLDPLIDVSFLGTDIRALIQGPASRWTDNLTLTSSAQATPGEGDATLSPSEAARIFESQLIESLLEQDGKIAFSNLASTTLASLMPKIEAGGNVGKARWRLTAAPSLPGLLSLDPDLDPFSNTGSFTLGSEAEISFGDSLQATLSRNLDVDEMRTELSLMYKLTSKLRLQLKSLSASATRVMFEFSTKE